MFKPQHRVFHQRHLLQMLLCFLLTLCLSLPSFGAILPDYVRNGKIMHAAGGLKGTYTYTNSKEALKGSIAKKVPSVEMDFCFTSDGILVCSHGWSSFGKTLSWKEYKKRKTIGGFTPMQAKTAIKYLSKSGTYLVVDAQGSDAVKIYAELVDICKKNGYSSYLKRIVPQIYKKSQYSALKKLYPFKNWIFTLYRLTMSSISDYESIGAFCKKKGIDVVTMGKARVDGMTVATIHKYGLLVAAHTINSPSVYKVMKDYGVDIIYTDHLYD